MAIFGTASPKIVSGATTIELDYAVILKSEPDEKSFVQENKLTGIDAHVDRGYHWNFEMRDHIYKYADPMAKYLALVALLGTEVNVYPHRDKTALSNAAGVVPFLFEEIIPEYIETVTYRDALVLKFTSLAFVDLSLSLS